MKRDNEKNDIIYIGKPTRAQLNRAATIFQVGFGGGWIKEMPKPYNHEVYHRFELFWYEPEVITILDDLFSGESDEVSKLTDRILSISGEDWRIAIVPMNIQAKEALKEEGDDR